MTKKLFLAAICAATMSSSVLADWKLGVGYTGFAEDNNGIDLTLGALTLNAGYEFPINDQFTFEPRASFGVGVNDDKMNIGNLTTIDVEVDRWINFSLRGEYAVNQEFYVFAQPSYGNLKLSAASGNSSFSADDWEFGIGLGMGFKANENIELEVGYDRFDDTGVFTSGISYRF